MAAKNLEMAIKSINPIIRGWGNYFKGGTVKNSFGELDGYIRGVEAKRRTLKILVFGIFPAVFVRSYYLIILEKFLCGNLRINIF